MNELMKQFVDELIDKCGIERAKTTELSVFDDVGLPSCFEYGWYGWLSNSSEVLEPICTNAIHVEKDEITANEADRFVDEAKGYFYERTHGLMTV